MKNKRNEFADVIRSNILVHKITSGLDIKSRFIPNTTLEEITNRSKNKKVFYSPFLRNIDWSEGLRKGSRCIYVFKLQDKDGHILRNLNFYSLRIKKLYTITNLSRFPHYSLINRSKNMGDREFDESNKLLYNKRKSLRDYIFGDKF